MGKGSKTKGLFRYCTEHACKKWRDRPSGRCAQFATLFAPRMPDVSPGQTDAVSELPSSSRDLPLGLLAITLIWIGPILACGSFQPRPTPTREPPPAAVPVETPIPEQPAPTAPSTPAPIPTETPVPSPSPTIVVRNPLTIGEQARITVIGGLNMREQPTVRSENITLVAQDKRILVLEGPVSADGYIWWKVDDSQGNVGWVAGGQGEEAWISAQVGVARPVDRSPIVGDRVVVSLVGELTVRALPGIGSAVVARATTNETFTVVAGPQAADGYFWYQIRSDDGQLEGWAADGREGERWLSPLE